MSYLYQALRKKEKELTDLLQTLSQLQRKQPDGTLHVSKINGHYRYYQYTLPKGSTHPQRRYIHMDNQALIGALAEKEYLKAMHASAVSQLTDIRKSLAHYDSELFDHVQEKLHPAKMPFITPLRMPIEQYIAEWEAQPYEGNPKPINNTEYYTERGEHVRSKSEMIIADRLYRHQIPYRYESPLAIPNRGIMYPDFTILNPHTREIWYWEHYGMIQDPDYALNFQVKFETFNSMGIFPGKNLILTFESANRPLNIKTVMRSIEEYLL